MDWQSLVSVGEYIALAEPMHVADLRLSLTTNLLKHNNRLIRWKEWMRKKVALDVHLGTQTDL